MPSIEKPQEYLYLFPSAIGNDANGALTLQWPDAGGAFGQTRPLATNDSLPTIQWHPGALSPDECRAVTEMGERLPRTDGRVELGPETYRVSHIAWVEPQPENHWLYHRLAVLFAQANRHFGFELTGFVDAIQYTVYGEEQHFDWHLDIGSDQTSARKLSMSIQLSDPGSYTGGELELISIGTGVESRQHGSATFFPSYLAHRVKPVTSGVRRSLIAWAYGPAFR